MTSNKEITREILNGRYVAAIEHLVNTFTLKSQREFASIMDESPTITSAIKSGHRNASIAQLAKLINDFNLNANFFLRMHNEQEPIEYNGTNISPNISGKNKNVMVGKNVTKNEGVVNGNYYNVKKIINDASPEAQAFVRELQRKYEVLEKENGHIKEEMNSCKKMITAANEQLQDAHAQIKEKDERLYKAQCELIEVYKKQND